MSDKSKIEWTEATWNPSTGCTKISAGCLNCYAEKLASRLMAMGNARYSNGFNITLHEDLIDLPKKWKSPRMIFVNSMSDLFHDDIPFEFIKRVFRTMENCPQHTFQVLTKRSKRLVDLAPRLKWPGNIWAGVTVENSSALRRIIDIRMVPANIRFLSCEPLIGALGDNLDLNGIDWVIVGGESGPCARHMRDEWVRQVYKACLSHKTPFFFKQWGGVHKWRNGREFEGRQHNGMPKYKKVAESAAQYAVRSH